MSPPSRERRASCFLCNAACKRDSVGQLLFRGWQCSRGARHHRQGTPDTGVSSEVCGKKKGFATSPATHHRTGVEFQLPFGQRAGPQFVFLRILPPPAIPETAWRRAAPSIQVDGRGGASATQLGKPIARSEVLPNLNRLAGGTGRGAARGKASPSDRPPRRGLATGWWQGVAE